MTASEIRERFLAFFERDSHRRIRSGSLVPAGDPTLLFTNAGMVPFKDFFTGLRKSPAPRAVSSQKCLRVSGKHNDLENVGRTSRHHTFFEMLGNFSFGNYFKSEACRFGWDFLTVEMKIPADRLWITVFETDDEAANIWHKEVGVARDRVLRFGEKDNFWSMGETGPCGPCSEIHYDHGEKYGCGKKSCGVGCDCDRFMEVWNLVFMQYDRDAAGKMTPLPKPSIDTGMGLERLAAVVQGVHSNYDSDLFRPIIREIESITGVKYSGKSESESDTSIRVLADHIRASVFLIADGIQPSNEGRGYVLRRIMRRAIRHGKLLGQSGPFFYRLADVVVREMGPAYPEIDKEKKTIERLIRAEEEKFLETMDRGLEILQEEIERAKKSKERVLPGEVVFSLYDTYGFPIDLTELIAGEAGLAIDMAGFERLMEEQRSRGRKAWKGSKKKSDFASLTNEIRCEFSGYEELEGKAPVVALFKGDKRVSSARPGDRVRVFTAKTPFYPEGGGQVGDRGLLEAKETSGEVVDTQKGGEGLIYHETEIKAGPLKEGDEAILKVNRDWREGSMLHHSSTHLLHAALRNVLGTHVRQAGSLVEPTRLRFDFSHFEPVGRDALREIEDQVNSQIEGNLAVRSEVLPYDEAIRRGALAFFDEKYGDKVRVVKMGDFSIELCGGTHVRSTTEIGLFKFTGESSVAAGVRRVEAVVGREALKRLREMEDQIQQLASCLKVPPGKLAERIEKLLEQVKSLEKKLEGERKRQASGEAEEKVIEAGGAKLLVVRTDLDDAGALRELSDQRIARLGSGLVLLGGGSGEKLAVVLRVSKDLTSRFNAGALLKESVQKLGGSGGGRPDMAQGGIPSSQWTAVLESLRDRISG